ncbi:MAG TPA: LON peptidase substrate-binding domain-containing protein [Tenuifilaceae bacterium]|nr:LON peptidase substrate-binding domain-containing protein [Tenuifilaceae bacterium]HOZ13855.1 LON peptidase substrate-binding domain-containing protein [Tenuifilaceae bacterium]HPN20808.1 LON peptidase substrate-binding domain-containing protein [Tenuifilaceae bacterium]
MAMFPLGVFLLPGEEIPLRIFEPRYKQLINECEENGNTFGIPYIIGDEIKTYGSEVELLNVVAKNNKGEMVILIKGVKNFHLLDFSESLPGKLYGGGIIEYVDDIYSTTNPELTVLVKKLKLNIDQILGSLITNDAINLFSIAKSIMLNSNEKFSFYSLRDNYKMEKYLIKRLRFIEQMQVQEKLLENNFSLN